MISRLSNQESFQVHAKQQINEVLRLLVWACAIAASCIGVIVLAIFYSPRSIERPLHTAIEPNDPYAVLARADRLLWLMNVSAAEPLYRRAEKLFHDLGDQRNEVYARVGELAAQTEGLSRSELSSLLENELRKPIVQSDSRLRLWCLVAKAYADLEYDPASAKKLWIEAHDTAHQLKDHLWATRTEGELGILALLLDSDRAKATRLFGQAFFGTMLNGDVAGHIRLLGILGNAFNEIRRYPEGLALFERAIKLARENPEIGFPFLSYEGKAEALLAQGKIAESRQILDQALALSRSQSNRTQESAVRVLLGKLEAQTGERRRGIAELERAAHIAKQLNFYRMTADSNFELAKLYTETSMSKARECLTVAVGASHRLGDLYFPPRELSALASLNAKLDNLSEADTLYSRAEDFVDERLRDVSTPYWETGFREALGDTYINHFKLATQKADVAQALEIIERVRGRAVSASLDIKPALNRQDSNSKTIEQQIASVQLQLMQHERTSNPSELLDKLGLLEQQLVLTPKGHPLPYHAAWRNPASLPVIQRSLHPDEELLEYVLDEPVAFCIAITKESAKIVPLQSGKTAIEKLTDTYISRIRARESVSDVGRQLYSILLAPLMLPPRSTRLLIVPDGKLHLLPFESLVDASGDFLLRSHVVSYTPSASLLHLLRTGHRSPKPRRTLLAVGGVLYHDLMPPDSSHPASQALRGLKDLFAAHLDNLPNTKNEVLALANILPANHTLLLGAEATETAFKAQPLADFKILHLAVHGVADTDFPDRAALVLGRDNNSNEDGLLQVREIMELHLNADLVTLSACDTAFGKLQGQEGVSNLEEAFFIAGARSVVASLWPADDTATSALMERFYRRLALGDDKASALRLAKLDLLQKYGNHTAPFYWAGFILSGDGASSISVP